jgi:transposase
VVQLANRAVDAVRREEARGERWLKKTRWCWLKDKGQVDAQGAVTRWIGCPTPG